MSRRRSVPLVAALAGTLVPVLAAAPAVASGTRPTAPPATAATAAHQHWRSVAAASPSTTPHPVGDLVPLGTSGSTVVALSSASGTNELWTTARRGWTRHVLPAGTNVKAVLVGSIVHLSFWEQFGTQYATQHLVEVGLDGEVLADGITSGERGSGGLVALGASGWWSNVAGQVVFHSWDVDTPAVTGTGIDASARWLGVGPSGTGHVASATPDVVAYRTTDGTTNELDLGAAVPNGRATVDATGVTVLGPALPNGDAQLCTVTATTAGCTELTGVPAAGLLGVFRAGGVTVVQGSGAFWTTATPAVGTAAATPVRIADATAGTAHLTDEGTRVLMVRAGSGPVWTFTAKGRLVRVATAA